MSDRASPEALAALREGLENQIAAEDPPEVAATFARLRREGYTEDAAWRLMSAVLLQEMSLIMRFGRSFDREGYIAAMRSLPQLSERDS